MTEKAKCKNCTNEKELIEEMAEIIFNSKYKNDYISPLKGANELYNAGYRKPLEGSVVLSKEEYEALQSSEKRYEQLVQSSCEAITKSRKETAKEFAEELLDTVLNLTPYMDLPKVAFALNHARLKVKEIAQKYGVEIKE